MSLKERIYGLETEYAINFYVDESLSSPNPTLIVQVLQQCLLEDCGIALSNFLVTGGKFHHDVGHAEWSLPECRSVRELVAYDKAADHLLRHAVVQAEQKLKHQGYKGHLLIAKNNVDSAGNSYGTHENYLMMRDTDLLAGNYFTDYLMHCLLPFLVTRQILAGSGHVLISPLDGRLTFELSQRARFINTVVNADTMRYRPLINLAREDQPLATGNYRRFHLILGDANLSGWATWMKVASLGIILRMIEDIFINDFPALKDPIDALHIIARDPTCKMPLPLRNDKHMSALDVQWYYLELANTYLAKCGFTDEEKAVVDAWERALTDMEHDPMRLRDRSDWVSKKYLMDAYLQKQGLSFENITSKDESVITQLQSLDLLYHDISTNGLFSSLWPEDTLLSAEEIRRAQFEPPRYTRARIRGTLGLLQEQYQIPVAIDDWINANVSNEIIELPDPLEFDHPRLYAVEKDPLKVLEQAVKRSPERADLHYQVGCFYLRLLRLKEAVQAFHEAIRIDANQANFHVALARALVLQGAYEKAILCYQMAHQLTEERSMLHFSGMGEAYRYLGHYEQALKAYSLQLRITPKDSSTHENIGQIYLKMGKIDAAEENFLFVHEQHPERHISALALGIIRFSRRARKLSVQTLLQRVLAPLSKNQAGEITPAALRYLQAFANLGMGNKEGLSLLRQALQHRTPLAAQGIFLVAPLVDLLNCTPKPPRDIRQIRTLVLNAETIYENMDENEGLTEIAPPEEVLWWQDAINHSNELIRARAAQYALWRKEGEAIPLLKNLLINDESDHVRCTAAKALAHLGSEEVGSILFACLHDPNCSIAVKWAAEEGLERISQGKAKSPLPWEMAAANKEEVQSIVIPSTWLTYHSVSILPPIRSVVCPLCGFAHFAVPVFCANCGFDFSNPINTGQRPPTSGGWGAPVPSSSPVNSSASGWQVAGSQQVAGWGMAASQQPPAWSAPAQPQSADPWGTSVAASQQPPAWSAPAQQQPQQPVWGAPVQQQPGGWDATAAQQQQAGGWGMPAQQPAWGAPAQQPPAWSAPAQPQSADPWGTSVAASQQPPAWGTYGAPQPPASPWPSSPAGQSDPSGSSSRNPDHDNSGNDDPLIEIVQ